MSTPLTRGQVQNRLTQLSNSTKYAAAPCHGYIAELADTDADLRQQLTQAQARVQTLEAALKECIEAWEHEGEPSAIGYELAVNIAIAALATPAAEQEEQMSDQGEQCPSCYAVRATWITGCRNPIHPIDKKLFEQAPCYLCGYNNGGYYQPDQHPCAKLYHEAHP